MTEHTKRCPMCGEIKPRAQGFSTSGTYPSGKPKWQAYCKSCHAGYKRERYAADPEPIRRSVQEWKQRNPEREREYQRRSRERRRRTGGGS